MSRRASDPGPILTSNDTGADRHEARTFFRPSAGRSRSKNSVIRSSGQGWGTGRWRSKGGLLGGNRRRPRAGARPGAVRGQHECRPAGRAGDVLSLALILHHRAALVRALLLALHFRPALPLALGLAGAGMAAVGRRTLPLPLARVDAGALHAGAGILLSLGGELMTAREHPDDRRGDDETQSL